MFQCSMNLFSLFYQRLIVMLNLPLSLCSSLSLSHFLSLSPSLSLPLSLSLSLSLSHLFSLPPSSSLSSLKP